MLTQHIALVPEAGGVDAAELARVSAALQKQMIRDLFPLWGITATVSAFPQLEDVPVGYWPLIVTDCELGHQGGVHLDQSGQPYAQIRHAPHWSLAASRACLEMLVNPFEHRSVTAPSLRSDQGPVEFFVEVCAPCEDPRHAYAIDDVLVSDFCTPAFFGVKSAEQPRYSFGGSITAPMQPLPGGHMTWYDPVSGGYWLRSHWRENPVDTQLGAIDKKATSLREIVNACAALRATSAVHVRRAPALPVGPSERALRASQLQAQRLRALLGRRLDQDLDAASYVLQLERESPLKAVPVAAPVAPVAPVAPPVARAKPAARGPQTAEFEIIADVALDEHEDTEVTSEYELLELQEQAAAPSASPSSPPPPLRATVSKPPTQIRPPTPSYAPVTLASVSDREPSERAGKGPWIAGLAAVAVIALVVGLRSGHRGAQPHAASAAKKPVAAAPAKPPVPVAAPAPAVAAVVPPAAPAEVQPVAPANPSVVAAPAKPAKAAKAEPPAELAHRVARKHAELLAPPVPHDSEHASATPAPAPASIDDLIQTRK